MFFLLWLAARFVQGCVLAMLLARLFGLDPKHPVLRLPRAVAEPVLELVRPLARRLPGPYDWAPPIALIGLELVCRVVG